MRGRLHVVVRAAICAGVLLGSTACYSSVAPRVKPDPRPDDCARSRIQVPSCGVLWGVTTQTPSVQSLHEVEHDVGRTFDMVYRFHAIGDAVPTADEREIVSGGRVLHLALDSGGLASAAAPGHVWADVAAGRFDSELRQMAKGIASLPAPVFVSFDHEANNPSKQVLGDPPQFVAAWRHVHELFTQAGTTNAIWVWVMMGSAETASTIGAYWPGNSYVDWISWDVYNQSGCLAGGIDPARYESFETALLPVYRWVRDHGSSVGMDPTKPMMISEAGSVVYPENSALSAKWYAGIPAALASYPEIKAIGLWDHTGNRLCDYRFQDDAAVLAAISEGGRDPRVAGKTE